jgi:hypothetical protein
MSVRRKTFAAVFAIATICAAAAVAQDDSQDPEVQRLNLQRMRDEAAITAYGKEKARIEAEIAARMAAVNALPEAKINETKLTQNANAGIAEARILSAQQLSTVARMIVAEINVSDRVIVLTADQKPDMASYREYAARRARVQFMYTEAARRQEEIEDQIELILGDTDPPRGLTEMSLATITSGVALLARLGSLFQSHYEIGGADVTNMDSAYLANAVAGVLANGQRTVFVGWEWVGETGYAAVVEDLSLLDQRRIRISRLLTQTQQSHARYQLASEAARDEAVKIKYGRVAQVYDDYDAELTNALNAHEIFVTWLTTAPENRQPPYNEVVRQLALANELNRAQVLVVQVHSASQGNMVQRNLWTYFGGPPFSVAASSSVTARVIDPSTGAISFAAAYGCNSPYTRMNRIHRRAQDNQTLVTCRRMT